jgi:tetratricopeptide (TPR) repeat protein
MEQLAIPGTIRLTAHTARLAEGYIETKALGPVAVKGLGEPIEVYELEGASSVRSRFQASAARGLTRFVGRVAELDQLDQVLERVRAGSGHIVAAVGEPGVGKSRLLWEVIHSERAQDCLIVEAGAVSYGKTTAYLPVIAMLKSYFEIEARDDHQKMREKVTGKVLSLDRTLEADLPAVLSLLDVPVEDVRWGLLDPPQRRRRILDSVKRLLLRESEIQPLVLVFEDLHWIDPETQALLDDVVESLPTARILLLVSFRPEYQHGWSSKTHYRQLRLDPLVATSGDELLDALLGRDTTLHSLKPRLMERTAGNPFFLEETVRALVETGALLGRTGAYQLAKPVAGLQISLTAQAILAARIDRLRSEDKRLLQAASVIGKDVLFPLLQAISEMTEDDLRHGLARLQAAEFLYETRFLPDPEYTFKHVLTQEVAYAGLTNDRRRTLDTALVTSIERSAGERISEHVERLAHHAFRGEVWPKAAVYLYKAGQRALDHSGYGQARVYLEQALTALARQPESRGTREQFVDIKIALRNSALVAGDLEGALIHCREALSVADQLQDLHRIELSCRILAGTLWTLGRAVEAVPFANRALETIEKMNDLGLYAVAQLTLGQIHFSLGHHRTAIRHHELALQHLPSDVGQRLFGRSSFLSADVRIYLAVCVSQQGDFERAIDLTNEAEQLAQAAQHSHTLLGAWVTRASAYHTRGDLPPAIQDLERGLALCAATNNVLWRVQYEAHLGRVYCLAHRTPEAIALLEESVTQAAAGRQRTRQARSMTWLGAAYLDAGRKDDARTIAIAALALASEREERGLEGHALHLLGEISARGGSAEDQRAEEYYSRALTLADEIGMRPLVAHCHAALAKLYADRCEHAEHRSLASTMYRGMGMNYWLEKLEAEMRAP